VLLQTCFWLIGHVCDPPSDPRADSAEEGKLTASAFANFGTRMKQAYDNQELGASAHIPISD